MKPLEIMCEVLALREPGLRFKGGIDVESITLGPVWQRRQLLLVYLVRQHNETRGGVVADLEPARIVADMCDTPRLFERFDRGRLKLEGVRSLTIEVQCAYQSEGHECCMFLKDRGSWALIVTAMNWPGATVDNLPAAPGLLIHHFILTHEQPNVSEHPPPESPHL